MRKKFSRKNVKRTLTSLKKVCAERIDTLPGDSFIIKRSDKYEILDLEESSVTLKLISKVFMEPESLFNICLEYKTIIEFNHKIDKGFVEKYIDEMLSSMGSDISYTISTLTNMLVDEYFIMPPIVSIDKE